MRGCGRRCCGVGGIDDIGISACLCGSGFGGIGISACMCDVVIGIDGRIGIGEGGTGGGGRHGGSYVSGGGCCIGGEVGARRQMAGVWVGASRDLWCEVVAWMSRAWV